MRTLLLSLTCLVLTACAGGKTAEQTDECGRPAEGSGIQICHFYATQSQNGRVTLSQSINLKNYESDHVDLKGWTLWDEQALASGTGAKSLDGYIMNPDSTMGVFPLPFTIDKSGETITLKDENGTVVHQLSN